MLAFVNLVCPAATEDSDESAKALDDESFESAGDSD